MIEAGNHQVVAMAQIVANRRPIGAKDEDDERDGPKPSMICPMCLYITCRCHELKKKGP